MGVSHPTELCIFVGNFMTVPLFIHICMFKKSYAEFTLFSRCNSQLRINFVHIENLQCSLELHILLV